MKELIIVESPTKARTIGQYLGKQFTVLSSQGHVRDLPKNDLGVDIDKGFEPKFEARRTKTITQLRDAAKQADRIYLATDHDREGEAIAADLQAILSRVAKNGEVFARLVFNEITKPAILEALRHATHIDEAKVEAQRTRRILDRLVGYLLSPLLSRVVAGNRFAGLSAGRVQSVALRLLCDRENQITQFSPEEYWEIEAELENGERFAASVTRKDGEKLRLTSEEEALAAVKEIRSAAARVEGITEKQRKRQPFPPLITSTLQQAASSQLGFSPKRTMSVAQELYEGIALAEGTVGLITYMRTDSVRMSEDAVAEARTLIRQEHGDAYLEPKPRGFKNKRGSQDAHEAIRPTSVERSPDAVSEYLTADQRRLYALIYRRFLATQMTAAVYLQRKIIVSAGVYTLEASGSTVEFEGFLRVMPESRGKENEIPVGLKAGDLLTVEALDPQQKFTEPPRRYSEAGLINLLEKEGIGRPSTYASILSVIQERGYAVREGGSLRPTLLGQTVVDFLQRFFAETTDPSFTAQMEEDLDQIEEGTMTREEALNEFYTPFAQRLSQLELQLEDGSQHVFSVGTDMLCETCGASMNLKFWKGSFFLGCSRYPDCRTTLNLPPTVPVRYGDQRVEVADSLAEVTSDVQTTVPCAACGASMDLRAGRYGRYYKCTNDSCGQTAPVSTGVACPQCEQGELVEKYSTKKRRVFYSCNRYPECRFAVSQRPVEYCPACEQGVLLEKDHGTACSNKACGYQGTAAQFTDDSSLPD